MKNKKYLAIIIFAIVALVCVIALVACKPEETPTPPQDYDMSGIVLHNDTVTYDGQAHSLAISGTLPSGVTVSYEYYKGNEIKEENKLTASPVNAGIYTVVAKFTGDEDHNEIEDKVATLTIEKADIVVVLGAKQEVNSSGIITDLAQPIEFAQNSDGSFSHDMDGHQYVISILESNLDPDDFTCLFYRRLNDDGSVDTESRREGYLPETVGSTVYALVTLTNEDYLDNYNATLQTSITVVKRTVKISTAEQLRQLRDLSDTINLRLNTKYVLTNNIDLGGSVWQTIWTEIPTITANNGFTGEFDGQGFTISNFVINEYSVDEDKVNARNGIAFSFFGYLTDAYIHDVAFADVTVSIDFAGLGRRGYLANVESNNLINPIYFGLVAARIDGAKNGMGTTFENISVNNLNAFVEVGKGYVGTFIGSENVGGGLRKNLDATNVEIYCIERGVSVAQSFRVGGIAGVALTPSVYQDCDLSDITLTLGQGIISETERTLALYVGGFAGSCSNAKLFDNCSITNFRIENWATTRVGVYAGSDFALSEFEGCVAACDNDVDYGVFECQVGRNPEKNPVAWKEVATPGEDA